MTFGLPQAPDVFGNFPIPYPKREFLSEDDEEKQDKSRSKVYTIHSSLYTIHFLLYTLHSTLYTLHSTLYTLK